MDENTGAISVTSTLDRDIQSEYELIVKATDTGKFILCFFLCFIFDFHVAPTIYPISKRDIMCG